jgi:heat shock protein HslJ
MKRILLPFAAFALLFAASACKHLPIDPNDPKDTINTPVHSLTGTAWKLHGLAVEGGQMQRPVNENFTLKFTTGSHAEGTAACNGFGADFKADAEKISFSNIVSTLAYCGDNSLDKHFMPALQSASHYTHDGNSLIIFSKSGVTLYFYAEGHPNGHDGKVVQFTDFEVVDFKIDPFQIHSISKIDDTHIAVKVSYSGGCAEHDFALFTDNEIMPGNATDFAKMMITHDAHGDMCNAWLTKELVFDVAPLLRKWQSNPHSNGRLALQFSQHNAGTIIFEK